MNRNGNRNANGNGNGTKTSTGPGIGPGTGNRKGPMIPSPIQSLGVTESCGRTWKLEAQARNKNIKYRKKNNLGVDWGH